MSDGDGKGYWEVIHLRDEKGRVIVRSRPVGGGDDLFTARGTVGIEVAAGRVMEVRFEQTLPGPTHVEAFAAFEELMERGAAEAREKAVAELSKPRIVLPTGQVRQ